MKVNIARVDVWAATIEDQPGGLAGKLAALAKAGADLEFVVARRCPTGPARGWCSWRLLRAPGGSRRHARRGSRRPRAFIRCESRRPTSPASGPG